MECTPTPDYMYWRMALGITVKILKESILKFEIFVLFAKKKSVIT